MTPEKVIEGKNVEQALKLAAEKYKLPVGKIKYEVISYGSTGIFGLVGAKKAKIKIILPNEEKIGKKEFPKREEKAAEQKPLVVEASQTDAEVPVPGEPTGHHEESTEETDASAVYVGTVDAEAAIDAGKIALQKILDMITTDATIGVEEKEETVIFNIIGGKSAVIIGKRGQTLEAIQYIIEKIVNRGSEKRIRLQIDVQGYLKNRRSNLEEMATRLAEKALRIGKPVTVGEMNVHDRKIVHMALKDHKSVRTQSMGTGFYRKLVIFPKKNGTKKRDEEKSEKKVGRERAARNARGGAGRKEEMNVDSPDPVVPDSGSEQ